MIIFWSIEMKTLFTVTLLVVVCPLFINTALAETDKKGWKGSSWSHNWKCSWARKFECL